MRCADKERAEAIAQLREWIKPGDTVYTILEYRHYHKDTKQLTSPIRIVIKGLEVETIGAVMPCTI